MLKHISTTINTTVCSRVLQGVFLVVLLAAFGLTACSSGGGSTTSDTNTTTTPTTLTTYTITASAGNGGTVTPSGATTVTQGASQSYTITPNANYAIATLVVDGTTVANSSTHTFINVQANHTISATFIVTAPGGIVLSLVPARTSGVAPLAVFFDASGTTDIGVTTRPFHDLEYTWSFGDPSSGTWASGAKPGVSSKNSATGPVAAHVFETPGTYTVTLTAFDGTSTASTTTTITVQDPDTVFAGTDTICINASGSDFTGCPSGADTSTNSNFVTALSANLATHKRILFKRGDTFTAAASAAITVDGPGIIGAFGVGAAPVVQKIGAGAIVNLSSSSTPNIKDWRIMDLEFDGLDTVDSIGVGTEGTIKQVLVLNMNMHNINEGVSFNGSILDWLYNAGYTNHSMYDEMAVVGSTITAITDFADGSRLFITANRLSIQGNNLGNFTAGLQGNHVVRIGYAEKGILSNNTLSRAGIPGATIKLHSQAWCQADSLPGECLTYNTTPPEAYSYLTTTHPIGIFQNLSGYTERVIISDNKFIGGQGAWTVTLGPQDNNRDERLRDIIFERNWLVSGSATQVAALFWTMDTTVRNNICDMSGGASHTCFRVTRRGEEPPPDNVRMYNNTLYSSSTGGFVGVDIGPTATNVSVINNLGSAPSATGPIMINGTGASGLVQSNNSTDFQMKNTFPGWVSTTPAVPADFGLTAGSYANNTGASAPVRSDFFRTSRPQNGVIDMGAVERP